MSLIDKGYGDASGRAAVLFRVPLGFPPLELGLAVGLSFGRRGGGSVVRVRIGGGGRRGCGSGGGRVGRGSRGLSPGDIPGLGDVLVHDEVVALLDEDEGQCVPVAPWQSKGWKESRENSYLLRRLCRRGLIFKGGFFVLLGALLLAQAQDSIY